MTNPTMSTVSAHNHLAPLLSVEDLCLDFWNQDQWVNIVNHISLKVYPGEAVGLVGESGCGKTTTAYSLLGYQRPNSRITAGQVRFKDRDLLSLSASALRHIRGRLVSFVPQNPTTSLSPGMRVGKQISEVLATHQIGNSGSTRLDRVHDLLNQVRLPDPVRTARKYPHQLSGGQQQRVVIAMALACNPELLLLDEPTTGLDVTTQAQILELLARLREEHQMAMLYVTHDLSVIATVCDRVAVMYAGEVVEDAPTDTIFKDPSHPYTRGLIASVPSIQNPHKERSILLEGYLKRDELPQGCRFAPRCHFAQDRCFVEPQSLALVDDQHHVACWRWGEISALLREQETMPDHLRHVDVLPDGLPLLEVTDLDLAYEQVRLHLFGPSAPRLVVRGVSFEIRPSETFALVGESGSGKSTIARATAGLLVPPDGEITYEGVNIAQDAKSRPQDLRRDIQLVLQNPDASLNPRHRILRIIGRPLQVFHRLKGSQLRERIAQLLEDVHLDRSYMYRFPDELSGGERQRVAIARALAANPRLMLCDEILSALDVSVQANVIDLLRNLQAEHQIAYLFISHDLAVVRALAHQVAVLYRGELCEYGLVEEVYSPPYHPYTHMLLSAVPEIDRATQLSPAIRSDATPSADEHTTACPFSDRCPWKIGPICDEVEPPWQSVGSTHALRCHIPLEELDTRWHQEQVTENAEPNLGNR